MKFLIDNQLPPALARFLTQEFHVEASHVQDLSLTRTRDRHLWQLAIEENLIVVSKDADFVPLCKATSSGQLIWVRITNCRRVQLLAAVRQAWPRIIRQLNQGERLVELR